MQSLFSSPRLSALDQSLPHLLQLAVHVLHNEVQGHKVLPTWQENGEEGSGHQPSPAASSSQRGASHPWAPRCPQPARSARCTARRPASQTSCSAPRSMAYILHQAPAIHGHGVGGYEQLESAGGCLPGHAPLPGSTSVRAAFVHVVGDLLQSIGVLVAATIIYFKPQCKIADPISTLFFSVFVLGSTLTILRDVFRVLMEGAPRGIEFDAVKEVLLAVSGVRGTHDLHIWALTLSHPVVSVHVAVGDANPETVLREATSQLQSKFGFVSCTVQVERYQEEALGCPHCQDPRA
uniref:Probable proton-coupled zinc antiporter SLC30A3 n=1 Tax=Anas platyrhynchos platyrhynchos TaxID=8840 RepID=A0A493TMG3_ANAPP